jgi:hypothetical protein
MGQHAPLGAQGAIINSRIRWLKLVHAPLQTS